MHQLMILEKGCMSSLYSRDFKYILSSYIALILSSDGKIVGLIHVILLFYEYIVIREYTYYYSRLNL